LASKATEFSRIKRQNDGTYAIEGHSMSLILVPIGSPYATCLILTYILSLTVSKL